MENRSLYDSSRKTVGAIYNDAIKNNSDSYVINGDLTNELQKSLADDLNNTILSKPYGDSPFYITIHEKKDLQMPRAILRRIITTKYRPYPEDDTIVYYHDPIEFRTYFCWCLPHHTEMDNMLVNSDLFDPEMIFKIRAWKNIQLEHFGFCKDYDGNWTVNHNYKGDIDIEKYKPKSRIIRI